MAKVSYTFSHQSVRDMAWAVASPPLICLAKQSCIWPDDQWYQHVYDESLPWLNKIDEDPSELESLLEKQKDRRLGKYFETLWFYWFSHNPRYEMIENNLQIIVDGETLGEIDFIVFDKKTKKMVHWEVAVKFYLGVGDTGEMCNWHGPNLRDRLDIKVHHLLQRQSIVSKNARVRKWLEENRLCIDQCAVILKGRLYYPWSGLAQNHAQERNQLELNGPSMKLRFPQQCSANHLHSWWLKKSQFVHEFDDQQYFMPLIKQGWMESISTDSKNDFYTKSEIFKTVSDKELRLPLQVQICDPCYNWDRVFIVEENWPVNTA